MNTLKFGNGEWYGKEGTILAYNDENNNYKPLPFTFERDSVATRVNKQGLIETVGADQPRIDYLNDSNGALLLEPQSTNNILYSNDISQSFNAQDITETQNYGIAPNGNNESTRVQITLSTSHYWKNYSLNSGVKYTASFYYKGIEGETTYLRAITVGGGSGNIKLITFNGDWQREELTFTAGSTVNYIYVTDNRAGVDNTATDFEVWGGQLEQGYPTSYIPTQGSAVTRLADVCNNGGNEQVINSTEGVLYAEISALDSSNIFDFGLYGNTSTNQCRIGFFNDDVYASLYNGSFQTQMSAPSNLSDFTKIAFKFSENDFALWIDGNEVATDTSGTTFNSGDLVKLNLSAQNGTSSLVTGNVKDVRVYDTALTDQELAALTQV